MAHDDDARVADLLARLGEDGTRDRPHDKADTPGYLQPVARPGGDDQLRT